MEIKTLKSIKHPEYVKIFSNNSFSFGGNQSWFEKQNRKIARGGCGLISVCDLLLYFAISDENWNTPFIKRHIPDLTHITKDQYMSYVFAFSKICLKVSREIGLTGIALCGAMESYARGYNLSLKAKWNFDISKDITSEISSMLSFDIPCIISVGPTLLRGKTRGVTFYRLSEERGFYSLSSGKVNGHFITVTRLLETTDPNHRLVYEVSSWGEKYYIDYSEYISWAKRFFLFEIFSNALLIKKA